MLLNNLVRNARSILNLSRVTVNIRGDIYNLSQRLKYTQNQGVKGIRNKKSMFEARSRALDEAEEEVEKSDNQDFKLEDREYDEVASNTMHVSRDFSRSENVLVIQPYVKWGPKRNILHPDDQLQEAETLVRSLPNWQVAMSLKVPLESLDRKVIFGSGKMEELKNLVSQLRQRNLGDQQPLTCLFISKGSLNFMQKSILEQEFKLPVMDRYSMVIQILRLHATSAEAKLQVAMAEIPYIWGQVKEANLSTTRKQGYSLSDTQREILKSRERKLRQELERIRGQRKLLRNRRQQKNYPTVAVVGYTNAGKTSLIKALTQEQSMQPRDQLFATLDVTAHAGMLPCKLEVIYMDTVGFMSDLPTGLFECFVSTLEDAMLADIIVHVQDMAHSCWVAQKEHVKVTLTSLAETIGYTNEVENDAPLLPPIINVGNKMDLVQNATDIKDNKELFLVSSVKNTGVSELLKEIEREILSNTGRRNILMRVRSGGSEMAWLYKNATVVDTRQDNKSAEHLLMNVVITESAMQKFKHYFLNKNKNET